MKIYFVIVHNVYRVSALFEKQHTEIVQYFQVSLHEPELNSRPAPSARVSSCCQNDELNMKVGWLVLKLNAGWPEREPVVQYQLQAEWFIEQEIWMGEEIA